LAGLRVFLVQLFLRELRSQPDSDIRVHPACAELRALHQCDGLIDQLRICRRRDLGFDNFALIVNGDVNDYRLDNARIGRINARTVGISGS
jgi:hypothetical protein